MDHIIAIIFTDTGLSAGGFLLLCATSFLASLITAMLGLGGGMLMLATMALYLTPAVLIPLHGAVQLGSNTARAVLMRADVIRWILPPFIIGSLAGALIGGNLVVALPVSWLKIVLALFILYSVWEPKFRARLPGRKMFVGVGVISTFATMFVGATGPLVAPFIAASSDKRQEVVATHAMMMTLQHLLKLVVFGLLGFAFQTWLPLLAALLVFGFGGTWVGSRLLNKMPEHVFRFGLKAVLTIIALRLLLGVLFGI